MLAAFPPQTLAATLPLQKTELVNVAEGKPVTARDLHIVPQYVLSKLVDGERDTFILSECGDEAAASEWIELDLLRRCKIEKIELFDRYDEDVVSGRQYIQILGAKQADFSDAEVLGNIDEANDEIFPHGGKWSVTLDGNKAYRYIKLQRTGGGAYRWAELKVWAKQTVTEVSRKAPATADNLADNSHWIYDFAPISHALDGESSTMWLEDGSAYRWLRIDLGDAYNIGMVEMSGRDFSADNRMDDDNGRKYISIYGSNDDATDNKMYDALNPITEEEAADLGFVRLTGVEANAVVDGDIKFPAVFVPNGMESTYGKSGGFSATCDDSTAVRYITYKSMKQAGAALTTFAAYVINPDVIGAETDGKKVYVEFSDEMDFDAVTADMAKVYVNGEEKTAQVAAKDEYTLELTLDKTYFDAKIKAEISKDMKNRKNTAMTENKSVDLVSPSAVNVDSIKITDSMAEGGNEITSLENATEVGVEVTMTNYMDDSDETAVVLMLMYDENNTMTAADERRIELGRGETKSATFGLEKGNAAKVTVFVWQNYNLMKPWIAKTTVK